jgi:hypothetical protein
MIRKPDRFGLTMLRRGLLAAALVAMLAVAWGCEPTADRPAGPPCWFKGNTHVHSRWSDGRDFPEVVAKWYKDQGYQFLVVTDHNTVQKGDKWALVAKPQEQAAFKTYLEQCGEALVEQRTDKGAAEGEPRLMVRAKRLDEYQDRFNEPGRFLLVRGEEITGSFQADEKSPKIQVHVNGLNTEDVIKPQRGPAMTDTIQADCVAVRDQGRKLKRPVFSHLDHPNWGGMIPVEDFCRAKDLVAFEVMNSCVHDVYNIGSDKFLSTDRLWDVALARRLGDHGLGVIYGVAADDSHEAATGGGGWVVVRAAGLEANALMKAMLAGDFYSSTGVRLKDVQRGPGAYVVEVDPDPDATYVIEFIGTRRGYDRSREDARDAKGALLPPTQRFSEQVGQVLKRVEGARGEYTPAGDELYVRARVLSSRMIPPPKPKEGEKPLEPLPQTAWTQPMVVKR